MGPIRRVCKRYSGRYCLEQPGSGGVGCSHLGADRVEQVGHCQETLWTEPGGLHCVMGAPGRQRKQQIQVPCQGPRTSAGNSWSQRWCLASGLRQPEWEHCLATLCGGHHQTGVPRQALLTPQASCRAAPSCRDDPHIGAYNFQAVTVSMCLYYHARITQFRPIGSQHGTAGQFVTAAS